MPHLMNISIEELASGVQKGHLFRDIQGGGESQEEKAGLFLVTGISVNQVIALYELLERFIFPYAIENISGDYKSRELDN